MGRKRKTAAERRQESEAAEQRAWEAFKPKLEALKTFAEALQLVAAAPRESAPGRRYYSNLGFFLQMFHVPAGSSDAERALYVRFIERLDAAGALKPGVAARILEDLRTSMREY